MSSLQKTYKRGEVIFKEGEKITHIVFIQSGAAQQSLLRNKKNIELASCGPNSVLGESGLAGLPAHNITVVATQETKTLEVPVDNFKQQIESAPQFLKMLIKSFSERLSKALQEIRSLKMANDLGPCSDPQVPQVFGAIFFTVLHKGVKQKDSKSYEVDWVLFKNYIQRVLGQSLKRVESATDILVKMKLASYVMGKPPEDPEGPDQKMSVIFSDLQPIEAFFEFFQYYCYKPGKSELLRVEDSSLQIVQLMLLCAEDLKPDRFGRVALEYATFSEKMQSELGVKLTADHFIRLENKGAFSRRRTSDDKVYIDFETQEYRNLLFSWKMIREIAKWNERGFVDLDEKEEVKKKKAEGPSCPQCGGLVSAEQKFCGECGHNLTAKAAA
jgi:CRP-like cAMP-binding protein